MNQRNAVYDAVVKVLGTSEFSGPVTLSKEQKQQVHALLVQGFVSGQIEYRGTATEGEFRKYVPGLTNNWLRKDRRLNGGEKYKAKNPGSRQGVGDEQLKAMRALLSVTSNEVDKATIQAAIDARKAELKPAKEIDASALPESLRHLVPVKQ